MIEVMDWVTKKVNSDRHPLEMLTINQMMPKDHLVSKLEATIDFKIQESRDPGLSEVRETA